MPTGRTIFGLVAAFLCLAVASHAARSQEYQDKSIDNQKDRSAAVLKKLTNALHDSDPKVRRNAALDLGHMRGFAAPALKDLAELLKDPKGQPNDVRLYAAEAIAYIGHDARDKLPQVLPALLEVIARDPSWQVRQRAVWALAGLEDIEKKPPDVVAALTAVLDETDVNSRLVRYEAAVLLGIRLGPKVPPKTIVVLVANLKDQTIRIYGGAATKVPSTGEDRKGDASWLPAMALKNIGAKALENATQSKDENVRNAAKEALKLIQK